MIYALIDSAGAVINIINWDGNPPWQPEPGVQAIQLAEDATVDIGWLYVDGIFTPAQES
jgi:hypothetical protein